MRNGYVEKITRTALTVFVCTMAVAWARVPYSLNAAERSTTFDENQGDVVTIPAGEDKEDTSIADFIFDDETETGETGIKNETTTPVEVKKEKTSVSLSRVKVKSASKKRSAKRMKIVLKKKVKIADGYVVFVYKKRGNVGKKYLLKKQVKKNKKRIIIRSKKIRNKSKLFVKIFAYKFVDGKMKVAKKGSKVKKVKIK
jgi:hypothetical protein